MLPARACGGTSASRCPRPKTAGVYRLALHKPPQIIRQRRGRGAAPRRLFLETLQANRLDIPRHRRVKQARPGRLGFHDLLEGLERSVRPERGPAGQELKK